MLRLRLRPVRSFPFGAQVLCDPVEGGDYTGEIRLYRPGSQGQESVSFLFHIARTESGTTVSILKGLEQWWTREVGQTSWLEVDISTLEGQLRFLILDLIMMAYMHTADFRDGQYPLLQELYPGKQSNLSGEGRQGSLFDIEFPFPHFLAEMLIFLPVPELERMVSALSGPGLAHTIFQDH